MREKLCEQIDVFINTKKGVLLHEPLRRDEIKGRKKSDSKCKCGEPLRYLSRSKDEKGEYVNVACPLCVIIRGCEVVT